MPGFSPRFTSDTSTDCHELRAMKIQVRTIVYGLLFYKSALAVEPCITGREFAFWICTKIPKHLKYDCIRNYRWNFYLFKCIRCQSMNFQFIWQSNTGDEKLWKFSASIGGFLSNEFRSFQMEMKWLRVASCSETLCLLHCIRGLGKLNKLVQFSRSASEIRKC